MHVSSIENNSKEHQPRCIGEVEITADQDRTEVLIKEDKPKNQQEEQEDRECDTRVTPCHEAAGQELQAAEGQVDESQDEHEIPDARQDMAHAQARARQAQVPTRGTSGTQGEEQETKTENRIPAAYVVDKETAERGQDAGREPEEATVVKNQPPKLIGGPKMPAFVAQQG